MCDSTKCDNCGKHSSVLHSVEDSWKYICTKCKEAKEDVEEEPEGARFDYTLYLEDWE